MSMFDGKQRVATERTCKYWGGHRRIEDAFRCFFCGHRFKPGNKWRCISDKKRIEKFIPFLVCDSCDNEDDVIVLRHFSHTKNYHDFIEEGKREYWWSDRMKLDD